VINNLNRLSLIWKELKRRNVTRVITVYAATAFVILELADIVAPSLGLPSWTLKFILILLAIGFVIAVIVSWIYDFHPLGGIVKTKPAEKATEEDVPRFANSWKIAAYISFVVIAGLVTLNILARSENNSRELIVDKSIAVLPFTSMTDDPAKGYLADGMMDAILLHLSKIEDLRVMSRTSVEQYRETEKTATAISKELDVAFILEGSFQKYGNQARLIVQLIRPGKEEYVWANQYDRDWHDIFSVQSEVAQQIAYELKAVITPEEKALIEKVPTTSLTAYDYYQQGREAYMKAILNRGNPEALEEATYLYTRALKFDPGFAKAYAGLALVNYRNYTSFTLSGGQYTADYFRSMSLDSIKTLAEKALALDDRIADAYYARGFYEYESGNLLEAETFLKQALAIEPNYSLAMIAAASVYEDLFDYVNSLKLLHKAAMLERGPVLAKIYFNLAWVYWEMDFQDISREYMKEYLAISGDTISYNLLMYYSEFVSGRQNSAMDYARASYAIDSTDRDAILFVGRTLLDAHMYEQAFPYYKRYFKGLDLSGDLDVNDMNRMGYVLWKVGNKKQANIYFQEMIKHCTRHIQMNSSYGREGATFDIAGVYAFLGEKDSAYHYLKLFGETNYHTTYMLSMLQELDPLFESIRAEERYLQLLRQMEANHLAERKRVSQWLEENDL
jgi:TolB-like protein/Tfp pilus assembly protein PilF